MNSADLNNLTFCFENASAMDIPPIPSLEQRDQSRKDFSRGKIVVLTSILYKIEIEGREQLKITKRCSNPNHPQLKKNTKKQKTQKVRCEAENKDENTICIYCIEEEHTSKGWVGCQLWVLAGVDDDADEIHICLYSEAK